MNTFQPGPPVNSRLIRAVLENDHERVERILAAGADVRCRDRHGTPIACHLGGASLEVLAVLRRYGFDPANVAFWPREPVDGWVEGTTLYFFNVPPLTYMMRRGLVDAARLRRLFASGISFDAAGICAVIEAINHKDAAAGCEMLKVLVDAFRPSVDPNLRAACLYGPMIEALERDNLNALHILRAAGGSVGRRGIFHCDSPDGLQFVLDEPEFDKNDAVNGIDPATNKTPLLMAVGRGNAPLARELVAQGADPDLRVVVGNRVGVSPRELAELRPSPDMLEALSGKRGGSIKPAR